MGGACGVAREWCAVKVGLTVVRRGGNGLRWGGMGGCVLSTNLDKDIPVWVYRLYDALDPARVTEKSN